ncbi:hypothetical protein KMZ68_02630 [Bradyrhizobium sediminis]|uniref:Uncharacterized protein n=1 Tax=Bradyrhizobium sediminis TaxID=2840469 RepID=A0A975RSB7_9BRAD|nr:hypothetical protein [Bradyrhizobium sediminis]QWG18807.1 hypothetical protein KMZ68_02630 [Bradyrhizobium sediminis]
MLTGPSDTLATHKSTSPCEGLFGAEEFVINRFSRNTDRCDFGMVFEVSEKAVSLGQVD